MPSKPTRSCHPSGLHLRVLTAAIAAFALSCGGGSGAGKPPPVDLATVDLCVLAGQTVADGCTTAADTSPLADLGDMAMGDSKSRVLIVYDGAAGDVAAQISAVTLDSTQSLANYQLSLFTVGAGGAEVPATLPMALGPSHANELRARVTFTANAAIGAVGGVSIKVVATHPSLARSVPVAGNVTGCPSGRGDCDGDPSNACETDLLADLAHCGSCAGACDATNGTPSCTNGICGITCNAGSANCDGSLSNGCEATLATDPLHCGACATACDATNGTASCTGGTCGIACNAGFADCDGNLANGCETNLNADPLHCGACATACSATNGTATCSGGSCGVTCNTGWGDCDGNASNGCETNLETDPVHCGTCATACNASAGSGTCSGGVCGITCNTGFANCDGNLANGCETSLDSDPAHCGACATACDATNGTATCSSGTCGITCSAGFGNCDGNAANGCETNLNADPVHCGACATACSTANGTASCSGGACGITCSAGFGNCDGNAANGCETSLNVDPLHCGACATACDGTNGTASCTGGACGITCNPGFGNCDGSVANGCEVNLATNPLHCGSCAIACSSTNGTPSCTGGACGIACSAGFGNCDGNAANGCETNLNTDPLHCGACVLACSSTNGTPSCTSGACAITCNSGYGNCDGDAANGCEVNLTKDPLHCGACSTACNGTNGTALCASGLCGITCNPGFANCDGSLANGCEVNLAADVANCGSCANACSSNNGTPSCAAGSCAIACNAGFGNCNGVASDGCEARLADDLANCGACANACPARANASPTCAGSVCGFACNPGYADCDGNPANGCEANLSKDLANCGACGHACSGNNGTPACTAGACSIACNAGFANCNGNVADGCEANLASDPANCGGCFNACPPRPNASPACSGSVCGFACNAGYYNQDGVAGNGCECQADGYSDSCAGAYGLGALAIGQIASASGNITPNADSDWFTVTLQQACNAHPMVTLSDGSGVLRMDVLSACGGSAVGCMDGPGAGVQAWEFFSCCAPGCLGPAVGPGVLYVRVYAVASSTTCLPYTVTFSD